MMPARATPLPPAPEVRIRRRATWPKIAPSTPSSDPMPQVHRPRIDTQDTTSEAIAKPSVCCDRGGPK